MQQNTLDLPKDHRIKVSKVLTLDLSGFGGGYENHCQQLLTVGLECLEMDPELAKTEGGRYIAPRINLLQERMLYLIKERKLDDGGTTGAQMGVATSAALFIHTNGMAAWVRAIAKEGRLGDLYDWDGTVNSVPRSESGERALETGRAVFGAETNN